VGVDLVALVVDRGGREARLARFLELAPAAPVLGRLHLAGVGGGHGAGEARKARAGVGAALGRGMQGGPDGRAGRWALARMRAGGSGRLAAAPRPAALRVAALVATDGTPPAPPPHDPPIPAAGAPTAPPGTVAERL
jgi:hypothetical protein